VPYRRPQGKYFTSLLAGILMLSLILMTVNARSDKVNLFFESIVVLFVFPAQSFFSSVTDSITDGLGHYFFLVRTSIENERLLLELDRLSKKNNKLLERNKFLERSANLTNFMDEDASPHVVAKVIGYDATQWSKVIFINKGTDHKVEKNLSVVTDAGVVGHVIHASLKSSKVLLITDSRSAVDSLFQESRKSGIVVGTGEDVCEMKFVSISAKVSVGDKVVSSGLGGVFRKGLVVGSVVDVVKEGHDLFQEIRLATSVNFSSLEEVVVLLSSQEEM
jgi:rod shape-determining protein MreC